LDFGCGCGRVIRTLHTVVPKSKLYGADIDQEAIEWLNKNYKKFGEFLVLPHLPQLLTPASSSIYFWISVFTHLPKICSSLAQGAEQDYEARRLPDYDLPWRKLLWQAGRWSQNSTENEGFFYTDFGQLWASLGLPDFYQAAYHTHEYIRINGESTLSTRYSETRIDELSDMVLLRNPGKNCACYITGVLKPKCLQHWRLW